MSVPFNFNAEEVIREGRTTHEAIVAVKTLLEKSSPSLSNLQDEFIVLFLLATDNNTLSARKTIENYFRIRNSRPEVFNNCNPERSELQNMLKRVGISVIPRRMDGNIVVIICRMLDSDYHDLDMLVGLKITSMAVDLSLNHNPPNGLIAIGDLAGVGFMHLTRFHLGGMFTAIRYIQEGFPVKPIAFHVLNANYIFDKLFQLSKAVVNNELLKLLVVHRPGMDMEEFHRKWVPASCLPEDYGGELPSLERLSKRFQKEVKEIQEFFDAEEEFRRKLES